MRYVMTLSCLLLIAAALGYSDPFLPALPLGAEPEAVRDAMGGAGWEIEHYKINPDGRVTIRGGNPSGWLLYYSYTPEGDPFSIILAEVWTEEGLRDESHDAWKERLSAQFGDPKTVESAYGDLLRWSNDFCTVELDTHAPEFYVEGYHTLVVLVLFQ